ENFINLNSSFIHAEVFKHFAHEAHFRPTIIFQTSDVPLLKSLVSQNTGIALLTDLALKNTDDLVALDIETNIPLNFIVSIAYCRSHILTPNQSKLISLLTDKKYSRIIDFGIFDSRLLIIYLLMSSYLGLFSAISSVAWRNTRLKIAKSRGATSSSKRSCKLSQNSLCCA